MKILKTDCDSALEIAKKFNNTHVYIETLMYSLCKRKKFQDFVNQISPSANITGFEKALEDYLNSKSNTSITIDKPKPSFSYEQILKHAFAVSALKESPNIMLEELINVIIENKNTNIFKLMSDNNIIPNFNKKIELTPFQLKNSDGVTFPVLTQSQVQQINQKIQSENKKASIEAFKVEFAKYTTCLNETITAEYKAPFGRENEIKELQRVLLRKNKNSIMITGEPGVGKSHLVESLAAEIVKGEVNPALKDIKIYSLSIHALLADIKYHGILEARLTALFAVLIDDPKKVLFIDEIHMLQGAGSQNGNLDILNFLKAPMSKNKLRIIGATTENEYRRFLEKNQAFTRRFAHLTVTEPTNAVTVNIIKNVKKDYEQFFGLKISNKIIEKVVDLTSLYIKDRYNPDKSFDILDSLLARKKLNQETKVTIEDVYEEISNICNIPSDSLTANKGEQLEKLRDYLKINVKGQNEALDQLVDYLKISYAGLKPKEKPMLSALFSGPTSVGKTETAKLLAEFMNIPLLRYDMSAFQERHTVSGLLGSPPGYIGYDDGSSGAGKLINDIDKNKHCVLLLDEIEKAHPDIFNLLLQIMDYGKLTSSSGKSVIFNKVIIIMTTNLGSEVIEKNPMGFNSKSDHKEGIEESIKGFLRPEFRARMDGSIVYKKLDSNTLAEVFDLQMIKLNKMIKEYNVSVNYNKEVVDFIVNEAIKSKLGARYIERLIADNIKKKLSTIILEKSQTEKLKKTVVFQENVIDLV